MKRFNDILSKNKENYIKNLEDLIIISKISTNSVQNYLLDKFTSLNCIIDDYNYLQLILNKDQVLKELL